VSTRRRSFARREALEGYAFIAPWLVGFFLFTAGPMVASLAISLTQWDIITPAKFLGVQNFRQMYLDKLFWTALYNTAFYAFLAVPLHVAGAFALALCLNVRIRGIGLFRTLYYIPSLAPAVANAILWLWLFNPDYGLLNELLDAFRLPAHPMWIYDPELAKPSLILMSMWGIGAAMVIFLAGLQGVPQELYEAAQIDGAGVLTRFRRVTVPMVSPVILYNLIVQIIASWQVFTYAYIMTQGGPLNATLFYVLHLYKQAFQLLHMGYASALAWGLFAIILAFTMLQLKLANRWVYYEGGLRQ
jgi:multiple sugar transport system permease protein